MPRISRRPGFEPPTIEAPEPVPKERCSATKLVRLSPRVRDLLARIAAKTGENESAVVRRLIEAESARCPNH
jgi:hypothetical protein